MPLKGTHSREPSLRGRGLRLSGSCSKVESTQSAMASGLGVVEVDIDTVIVIFIVLVAVTVTVHRAWLGLEVVEWRWPGQPETARDTRHCPYLYCCRRRFLHLYRSGPVTRSAPLTQLPSLNKT
jgi:hypothetical protein